jgi:hypothetical protein
LMAKQQDPLFYLGLCCVFYLTISLPIYPCP